MGGLENTENLGLRNEPLSCTPTISPEPDITFCDLRPRTARTSSPGLSMGPPPNTKRPGSMVSSLP